ncbi:MAG: twin-arginine translocase subunit TatC [Solirubrobacterales bacterium]|nr:twin-arginine translocase subunit TatC [Solirubrobacterales bacterium]
MRRLLPPSFGDELTVVEHLEELRLRLIVSLAAFGVALGLCFWQNRLLLRLVDAPLQGRRPVTFGVAEPFTATLTVAAYAAVAIALPVLLYQLYAYVLPAFTPAERRIARPLLVMIPGLFGAGVLFGYFIVVPTALHFLLHFNEHEFNVQLRAGDWYSFFGITMLASGLVFQVPVGVLAAVALGLTTPQQLRAKRRYAIAVCALIAAVLPGVDPLSMLIEMMPLIALYELSILIAAAIPRRAAVATDAA